jgi:hypothetical protein
MAITPQNGYLTPVDDFVVYQPEMLGVWLVPIDEKYVEIESSYFGLKEWNVNNVSLGEILEKTTDKDGFESRYVILTAKQATEAFRVLDNSLNILFFEENASGKKSYYFVEVRPILPFETLENKYHYEISDSTAKPSEPIGCNESDGMLPIPSP